MPGYMNVAVFKFVIPYFAQQEYIINVDIIDGTLQNNKLLQLMDGAANIKFESNHQDGYEVGLTYALCTVIDEKC